MNLTFNTVTGFVPLNYAPGDSPSICPGLLTEKERQLLRWLGRRVVEIAADPSYREKRRLWTRHNRLEGERPMVYVVVEAAWREVLPQGSCEIGDLFWRQWEWYLRQLIYRHENIDDDFVILPKLKVPAVFENTGWGLEMQTTKPREKFGAYRWETVLRDREDLRRMHFPRIVIDRQGSERNCEAVSEVFEGIMPARLHERVVLDTALVPTLTNLHGFERTLLDMHDDPAFLHEVMEFITQGVESLMDSVEAGGMANSNNENDYVGSGGLGFSDELPKAPRAAGEYTFRDLWGFATTQEYTGISPAMFEEFAVRYQARLLKRYGLVNYGCCERMDDKIDMLTRHVPNLRRVSISPFADRKAAAEALQDRYIYSWKPNPAYHVACPHFSEDNVRRDIRETLDITRGCRLEIILKDTETVNGDPGRLSRWSRIARELVSA